MRKSLLIALCCAVPLGASAQQINDRATLNSLLTSSVTDDFESFDIGSGGATTTDVSSLDSGSVVNGQGPGLVNPGATYSGDGSIQWNGDQYYNIATKSILDNSSNGTLKIDYANGTQAMGLDANNFVGFGYSGQMDVYNGASLVGTVKFNLAGNGGETVFLGYQNAAGITSVVISSPTYSWSPIIDNHTYGVVPEPFSMATLGIGALALLRRKRKN